MPVTPLQAAETIHNAARTRYNLIAADGWVVQYDNAPFEPPDNSKWVQWHIEIGNSQLVQFGQSRTYRHFGEATASLFVPIESGDRDILRRADVIAAVFRNTTADGVHWRVPTVRSIGQQGQKWWRVNVVCPFFADEIQ